MIEGKLFGIEKGYEKFVQLGKLHGRSVVWASRMPRIKQQLEVAPKTTKSDEERYEPFLDLEKLAIDELPLQAETAAARNEPRSVLLPLLPDTLRLEKHVRMLFALTEPETFSTENNEDAVADFDDRFKRAAARATIIGRMVGEESGVAVPSAAAPSSKKGGAAESSNEDASIEDASVLHARH